MTTQASELVISVMLAVDDTPAAVDWYKRTLGGAELWSFGPVAVSGRIRVGVRDD